MRGNDLFEVPAPASSAAVQRRPRSRKNLLSSLVGSPSFRKETSLEDGLGKPEGSRASVGGLSSEDEPAVPPERREAGARSIPAGALEAGPSWMEKRARGCQAPPRDLPSCFEVRGSLDQRLLGPLGLLTPFPRVKDPLANPVSQGRHFHQFVLRQELERLVQAHLLRRAQAALDVLVG